MSNPLLPEGKGMGSNANKSSVDMYVAKGPLPEVPAPQKTYKKQTALVSGPSHLDCLNTLLVRTEEIAANLTRLEKKFETISSPTNTTAPAQQVPHPGHKHFPTVPPNSCINSLLLGQVVICKWFDQTNPFDVISLPQIAKKINEAMTFSKVKVVQEPIKVKVVALFPNGDVRFFTKDCSLQKKLAQLPAVDMQHAPAKL
ncbi:hypothetical protein VP01_218g2 [Puccinia sorghi]|uniref:Uncharacterized protein n=1 Tax=Puccinia sorghi TaxID=27349 RepID=A0A0L6V9A9_9BASI|nr:hypothetical protein VP01_218g2 [Puccinia sorghi]